jgi:hypothetical protein
LSCNAGPGTPAERAAPIEREVSTREAKAKWCGYELATAERQNVPDRSRTAANMKRLSLWVRTPHEPIGRLQDGVPLDHLSSADLAKSATAVGDGQFDIAYNVQCPAMSAGKVAAMSDCWSAHRCLMRLNTRWRQPRRLKAPWRRAALPATRHPHGCTR